MPDLGALLASLGDNGATLTKGLIISVQTGTLTVSVRGGQFTRVPYMQGAWVPVAGQYVYLLAQQDFGMIALGSPTPTGGAAPDPGIPTVLAIDPLTMSNWQVSDAYPQGHWVDLAGTLVQSAQQASSGVWFYSPAALAGMANLSLGQFEVELMVESGGFVELTLHKTTPGGPSPVDTVELPVMEQSRSFPVSGVGNTSWIPLPLHWSELLSSGVASGIMARSVLYDARLFGHGTLRVTSL
ncbi:hypothetical protein [Longimicrobium sp.]|jgi:hypothetical protein|uniref:hypothetical protein n=1 Tax=Longimicrobium sp. TaxID=2029185 RepID=UPI002ED92436